MRRLAGGFALGLLVVFITSYWWIPGIAKENWLKGCLWEKTAANEIGWCHRAAATMFD